MKFELISLLNFTLKKSIISNAFLRFDRTMTAYDVPPPQQSGTRYAPV